MSLDNRRMERLARILEEIAQPPRDIHGIKHVLHWTPQYAYTSGNIELLKQSPAGSFVYEIWELREQLWVACYIGETDRLGERLEEHVRSRDENPGFLKADFGRLAFSYAPVPTQAFRKDVERALWKLYQYGWNDSAGPQGARGQGTLIVEEYFPEPYSVNYNGTRRWLECIGSYISLP